MLLHPFHCTDIYFSVCKDVVESMHENSILYFSMFACWRHVLEQKSEIEINRAVGNDYAPEEKKYKQQ